MADHYVENLRITLSTLNRLEETRTGDDKARVAAAIEIVEDEIQNPQTSLQEVAP